VIEREKVERRNTQSRCYIKHQGNMRSRTRNLVDGGFKMIGEVLAWDMLT
jgi:hypothetical protein